MPTRQHKILMTGGSGTLGQNFLALVQNDPQFEVLSLTRQGSRSLTSGSHSSFCIDFNDRAAIDAAIDEFQPTCFLHAAATGMNFPKTEWFDLIRFNVGVSLNFCESVARLGQCHFIFIGTGLAYKNQDKPLDEESPLDTLHPYGASKAAADMLMRAAAVEFGVPLTVLRPFSFTGIGDTGTRLFPSLLRAAATGQTMDLSAGDQIRDHCSARDIASGIRSAIINQATDSREPRTYNLGSGSMTCLRQLLENLAAELNLKIKLNFGAKPYAPFEPMCLVAATAAAQRDLGWAPRHNLAHAVWQLAQKSFPMLEVRQPREDIHV